MDFNCLFYHPHARALAAHAQNRLAAANPEIRASVTDVISGYICDKERKRAEQTNREQHAASIHRAANRYWRLDRGKKKKEEEEKQQCHAPSAGCILTAHSEDRKLVNSAQHPTQRAGVETSMSLSSNLLREMRKGR